MCALQALLLLLLLLLVKARVPVIIIRHKQSRQTIFKILYITYHLIFVANF